MKNKAHLDVSMITRGKLSDLTYKKTRYSNVACVKHMSALLFFYWVFP